MRLFFAFAFFLCNRCLKLLTIFYLAWTQMRHPAENLGSLGHTRLEQTLLTSSGSPYLTLFDARYFKENNN